MHVQSQIGPGKASLPLRSRDQSFDIVIAAVARVEGVSERLFLHPSRCRAPAALARQIAMYLSHVTLGRCMASVGRAYGRDRTTVAYACRKIEDMRDDARFDARLERLEDDIMQALAREDADVG